MKNDPLSRSAEDISLESRRQSVRKILGLGGTIAGTAIASGTWITPVTRAVVLPAHAQATGDLFLTDPCSITVVCTSIANFNVTVNGFVIPATPGINIELAYQTAFNGPYGAAQPFGSGVTDAGGEYSVTNAVGPVVATDIRITVTLPDFPEAGDATCELSFTDSGPHSPYSPGGTYFCYYSAGS